MSNEADSSSASPNIPQNSAQIEVEQCISLSAIIEGLQAVQFVLGLSSNGLRTIIRTVTEVRKDHGKESTLKEWLEVTKPIDFTNASHHFILQMVIALAFLRESGRKNKAFSSLDLDQVWASIKNALQCTSLVWSVTRCVDGSHVIPLWRLITHDHLHEKFSLRIWLPEADEMESIPVIHEPQAFTHSWTLAGEAKCHILATEPAEKDNATHREYTFDRTETAEGADTTGQGGRSIWPTMADTGKLCRVSEKSAELCTRDKSYRITAGCFHELHVEHGSVYAELSFFDASRGHIEPVAVLRPVSWNDFPDHHELSIANVGDIVYLITDLRSWELFQRIGLAHSDRGDWEEALRSYRTALYTCQKNHWLDCPRYKHVTLGAIGKMYRMSGRYAQACKCLEETVIDAPQSRFRVDCAGELAMVYRHMDRLEDSKQAAEEQYRGAKQLNLEKFACRAIGNVGMVNYQLYLLNKEDALLSDAISQLKERIVRAQKFGDIVLEAIGYSRLSLCYIAKGDYEKAVQIAQKNFDLTCLQPDATKIGFAKAFLGRALLFAGQKDEALALFNAPGGCSPIIALCNEISSEHRQYIIEMINAGADLKLRDQRGYSALECAIYNGDDATARIIEQGLRAQILKEGGNIDEQIKQLKYEAVLRKGYRNIFQDKLRPVLLEGSDKSALQILRQTYAASLADDVEHQNTFDCLKYVRYADFVGCGRLPRFNDGYTQKASEGEANHQNPYIVFFSYRWIAKDVRADASEFSPDDALHTQYNRMLAAIELFLDIHRDVNQDQLGIWVDFACVDQDHQRPGVAALPMNLAQCNAMISLVDDKYYERSWCCVEVLMFQTLRKAYEGVYTWYEHIVSSSEQGQSLRIGPRSLEVDMSKKQVTYESDRPKLLFLERQTKLLG